MDSIWFTLLIPILACILVFRYFELRLVWWEVVVTILSNAVLIWFCILIGHYNSSRDVQYRGAIITHAVYYEYWSTWIEETCTREVPDGETCTGEGSNRSCTTNYRTESYDCSHCDENRAEWWIYDDQNHKWRITKEEYEALQKRWGAKPEFIDLHRDINEHGSCGIDGDAYAIYWNHDPQTAIPTTVEDGYTNKVMTAKSSFNFNEISESDIKTYGLHEYPDITNRFHQQTLVGIDTLEYLTAQQKQYYNQLFDFFNGKYGPERKMRLYILFFSGKTLTSAIKQKDYWVGGNKNEMVVCIDADKKTGRLNWVYAFSWTPSRRISIDLREDIMNQKTLNLSNLYTIVEEDTKDFHYLDFAIYDFIEPGVSNMLVIITIILVVILTGVLLYVFSNNEFEILDNTPLIVLKQPLSKSWGNFTGKIKNQVQKTWVKFKK